MNPTHITTAEIEAPKSELAKFVRYFAARGIPHQAIVDNRITLVSQDVLAQRIKGARAVLDNVSWAALFPYHDIDGVPQEYYGARVLSEARASFTSVSSAKFVVSAGPGRLYFPLTNPAPGGRCVITESPLKAIAISICGVYAIGLNGCYGYSTRKSRSGLIDDFSSIPWDAFSDVVFLPDSDWATNPRVGNSVELFADRLAMVHRTTLKHLQLKSEEKIGIDDYLAQNGLDATTEFLKSPAASIKPTEFALAMLRLNSQICYVKETNCFVNIEDNYTLSQQHFITLYATEKYRNAEGKYKSSAPAWIQWPERRAVQKIVNKPGAEEITDEYYNVWRPSEVVPVKGSVSTHLKFLERAIPEPTERHFLQQWIAHLLQRPAKKMSTALVFYSAEEGTGKTMLAHAISYLVGRSNSARTTQEVFKGQFNESYATKQLVVINESLCDDSRDSSTMMEKLKSFITEDVVTVRKMRIDPYEIDNYCHVILTSNHLTAIKPSPSDRRFAMFEFLSQFRHSEEAERWGEECWEWHQEHLPELAWYYLNEVSIEDFKPNAPAPVTNIKREMFAAALSEEEAFVQRLLEQTDDALMEYRLRKDLRYLESGMAMQIYMGLVGEVGSGHATAVKLGAAFKRFGVEKIQRRAGGKLWRAYDLRPRSDGEGDFSKDVLSPRGSKFDG